MANGCPLTNNMYPPNMQGRKAAAAANLREILNNSTLHSGWGSSMCRWTDLDRRIKQNDTLLAAEVDLMKINTLLTQNKLHEARAEVKNCLHAQPGSDHKFMFDLLLALSVPSSFAEK